MARPQNALIVDDEAHVRMFLRLLLKELGIHTCWEAADGAQALELVRRHAPDLVLLDVNLPVKNGLAVLTDIRRDHPDVPVVMVSAQSTMTTVLEASRLGAISYVLKQSPREEARQTLQEAIDSLADDDE